MSTAKRRLRCYDVTSGADHDNEIRDNIGDPTPVPHAALARALALAEEMSYCTAYHLQDADGNSLGVDPGITRDLERVHEFLRALRRR